MNVLAVDTSGPVCGVAVTREGRLIYEGAAVNRMTHSANLMPMVEEALIRSGMAVEEMDLFAAVTGPGSFTGVRIGVSTVKGLAHGAGKPCAGVDALEALAAGVSQTDALICPMQDARAGQVYGAAFRGGFPPVRLCEDVAETLEQFIHRATALAGERTLCFVGDGVEPNRDKLTALLGARAVFPAAHLSILRPGAVALLAEARPERFTDYLGLLPHYLRAPQAERARTARQKAEEA